MKLNISCIKVAKKLKTSKKVKLGLFGFYVKNLKARFFEAIFNPSVKPLISDGQIQIEQFYLDHKDSHTFGDIEPI